MFMKSPTCSPTCRLLPPLTLIWIAPFVASLFALLCHVLISINIKWHQTLHCQSAEKPKVDNCLEITHPADWTLGQAVPQGLAKSVFRFSFRFIQKNRKHQNTTCRNAQKWVNTIYGKSKWCHLLLDKLESTHTSGGKKWPNRKHLVTVFSLVIKKTRPTKTCCVNNHYIKPW